MTDLEHVRDCHRPSLSTDLRTVNGYVLRRCPECGAQALIRQERRPDDSPDGWPVEQIQAQRSLSKPPVTRLRATWRGYRRPGCATVAEVARHVDLATLAPEHPVRRSSSESPCARRHQTLLRLRALLRPVAYARPS